MRYLGLKTKAQLLTGAFVCKHQVASCCLRLSFVFVKQAGICTGKGGMRWVIFSPEHVGQLISYHYISGKLEYIYPEKQQDKQ